MRRLSSALGRAYREEAVPEALARRETSAPPARRYVALRELSPTARAGRIARLRHDAPKLERSLRHRFAGVAAALAASVALAGIVLLQRAGESGAAPSRDVPSRVQQDRVELPGPSLEERIARRLEEEALEQAAEMDAVSTEIARGLEPLFGSEGTPSPAPVPSPEQAVVALEASQEVDWLALERRALVVGSPPPASEEEKEAERRRRAAVATFGPARPSLDRLDVASFARPDGMPRPAAGSSIVAGGFRLSGRDAAVSFALQVDTASYGVVRRALAEARWPASEEVRIEELVNYFTYASDAPRRIEPPFGVEMEVGQAPWEPVHYLVRVTLKAVEPPTGAEDAALALAILGARAEVRFNPAQVSAYRLLGYDRGDGVVAPTPGSSTPPRSSEALLYGQEVTALYEIVPVGAPSTPGLVEGGRFEASPVAARGLRETSSELLWMEVRFARPEEAQRQRRVDFILHVPPEIPSWRETSRAFRWAAAVASFGMELKDDPWRGRLDWNLIETLARSSVEGEEAPAAEHIEFLDLIGHARALLPGAS
jgi:hypothetical protein